MMEQRQIQFFGAQTRLAAATRWTSRRMRDLLALALLAPALLLGVASEAGAEVDPLDEPRALIEQASADMLKVLQDGRGYFADDPDRLYRAMEATMVKFVDFPVLSRRVMAVHAKRATAEQRERFAEVFKWGLVRTFGKALIEFDNEKIDLLPPGKADRGKTNRATVRMQVTAKDGSRIPLEYSLAKSKKDDVWRVLNVIVNGVNLGLTYSNQFASAMNAPKNGGDIDKVIDDWATVVEPVAGA